MAKLLPSEHSFDMGTVFYGETTTSSVSTVRIQRPFPVCYCFDFPFSNSMFRTEWELFLEIFRCSSTISL